MSGLATRVRAAISSRWFKLALSATLLAILLHETDLGAMRAALAAADLGLMTLAWLVVVISQVASAYRWCLLAQAVGFDEPFTRFCVYYFSGMYLNLFGPGTVTGDVGRTLFLAGGRRRALALTTVIAHRATGFVALVWITCVAIVLLPDQPLPSVARWLAALTVPLTLLGWLWGPRLAARLLSPNNHWRLLIERDLAVYWHHTGVITASLALATLAQGLQLVAQWLIGAALGQTLAWTFLLVIVPLVGIVATLPFSLQGIGVRETGYWYYLSRMGVPHEAAIALGLLTSAVALAAGLTGLPFFLFVRRAAPPDGEPVASQR